MIMSKGALICFIGIDGSGKSTISLEVNNIFQAKGIKTKYVYGRIVPFFSRLLMWAGRLFILKRKKEDLYLDYDNYVSQKKMKLNSNYFLSRIYMYALLLDQVLQTITKISIPLLFGKTVICDRYVYDTVITDIAIDFNLSLDEILDLINKMLCIIPKPDIVFYIDVPEDVAFGRKNDVAHIGYLADRRKCYKQIAEEYSFITLNGVKTVNDIVEKILISYLGVSL